MPNFFKQIKSINCYNKPYYPLIILISRIEYIDETHISEYYNQVFMKTIYNNFISKNHNNCLNRMLIDIEKLEKYLNTLRKRNKNNN
ncbi:hypothetical protein HNP67_001196 [Borreliella californiensis]|uniref:Uncharacterized protein n=1 Tax=Borreliella californiensis TaxID=373543 RepID=A0A7W9ZLG5_9SPIR|nr:hypothetical protein [Borreliella californiensis]